MAETVRGGRYKVGDAWVDANGKTIKAPGAADEPTAEELAQQREQELSMALAQQHAQMQAIMAVLTPEQLTALEAAKPAATGDDGKSTTRRSRGDKGEEK